MNKLAKTYADVAEFFIVYIREAHAADSSWPIAISGEDTINTPNSIIERSAIAKKCCTKLRIELPCLVDDMENTVDSAYDAWPDRIFVVDKLGIVAVRADR